MNWATHAITSLIEGKPCTITPHGNSMLPLIQSGEEVSLEPYPDTETPQVGDIVLVRVRGNTYLHLVKAVQGDRYQIGNNRGHINGWVSRNAIYGRRKP